MGLENLVKELDPRHDLDRFDLNNSYNKNFFITLASVPKHAVRGAVAGGTIGAGIGALVSVATGNNVAAWAVGYGTIGGAVAGGIDMLQFIWRYFLSKDSSFYKYRKPT